MYELYDFAELKRIAVYRQSIPLTQEMAIPGAICLDENLLFDGVLERTIMAHELGHCATNAFYTRNDPPYIRRRMENRADKWAIKKLVPLDKLKAAIKAGNTEVWQLADYFRVSDQMMLKALCLYQNGNLALEYFAAL